MLRGYLRQLQACRSTTDILDCLLDRMKVHCVPIESIRYYRVRRIRLSDYLVSVDSAGHDQHVSTQLRLGRIVKELRDKDEVRTDGSFDVISSGGEAGGLSTGSGLRVSIQLVQNEPLQYCVLRSDGEKSEQYSRSGGNASCLGRCPPSHGWTDPRETVVQP